MPITRISPDENAESDLALDVFHIQEAIEVYDGTLALAIDHLLNHIKVLVSMAYLPGSSDLQQALSRHPQLRREGRKDAPLQAAGLNGRAADRVLLAECERLLDSVRKIAHLAAWPETAQLAQEELARLQREVPFLDYRYDNDPFPSDRDRENL